MNAYLTPPLIEPRADAHPPRPAAAIPRRALPLLSSAASAEKSAPPPPRSVRVSVTDRCDFACTYCRPSHHDGYSEGRLLVPVWRSMFAGLKQAGVRRVRLTGGEPLIHPEILAIVSELASLGFEDIALTTNASQLARLAH